MDGRRQTKIERSGQMQTHARTTTRGDTWDADTCMHHTCTHNHTQTHARTTTRGDTSRRISTETHEDRWRATTDVGAGCGGGTGRSRGKRATRAGERALGVNSLIPSTRRCLLPSASASRSPPPSPSACLANAVAHLLARSCSRRLPTQLAARNNPTNKHE